jgi:hypothetical protein
MLTFASWLVGEGENFSVGVAELAGFIDNQRRISWCGGSLEKMNSLKQLPTESLRCNLKET